jgi:hypothetical protein
MQYKNYDFAFDPPLDELASSYELPEALAMQALIESVPLGMRRDDFFRQNKYTESMRARLTSSNISFIDYVIGRAADQAEKLMVLQKWAAECTQRTVEVTEIL